MPALVFFGIATVVGVLIRGIVGVRLRAAARQPVSDEVLCELNQAKRISSTAVLVALVCLVAVGLALVAL